MPYNLNNLGAPQDENIVYEGADSAKVGSLTETLQSHPFNRKGYINSQQVNTWAIIFLPLFQAHVNQYCWTHSLYHYPNYTDRTVMPYNLNNLGAPEDENIVYEGADSAKVGYFRFVTIIFLVQAFMFKVKVWILFVFYISLALRVTSCLLG